jgi:hypothetical protein
LKETTSAIRAAANKDDRNGLSAHYALPTVVFLPEAGVNRIFVEGPGPSTHIRSRFPLHPSLSAVNGASIEEEGERCSVHVSLSSRADRDRKGAKCEESAQHSSGRGNLNTTHRAVNGAMNASSIQKIYTNERT